MLKWFASFLILTCLFCDPCVAQDTIQDSSTGLSFPKSVSISHGENSYQLGATGVSTRKKFFVKVYSVAHYIQDPESFKGGDVFEQIMSSHKTKQLTSIWARNVDQDKVQSGYRESFGKILSAEGMKMFNGEINKYINFFGAVKKNDRHVIRWLPDGTVTVTINGQEKGSIQNAEFARALWEIWLGKRSVVDRNKLVSLVQ